MIKSGFKVVIALLAAGNSSRMGRPKQLLEINNQTLLERTLSASLQSSASETYVVLGAFHRQLSTIVQGYKVNVHVNENWEAGLATSIHSAVAHITATDQTVDAILFALCDQPFLTSNLINELIDVYIITKSPIVYCQYDESFGPPVLFDRSMFSQLIDLEGNLGAKRILESHQNSAVAISFPKGNIDLDTEMDYIDYLNSLQN